MRRALCMRSAGGVINKLCVDKQQYQRMSWYQEMFYSKIYMLS